MKKMTLLAAVAAVVLASCAGNPEGQKAETKDSLAVSAVVDGQDFAVDTAQSTVVWTGTKVTGAHTGTVTVSSGKLIVADGKLAGGNFVLDLNTINTTDLEGEYKDKLDGHLKADDFFAVASHPKATFTITQVEPGATADVVKVSGNLEIKGISKNITFDAKVTENTDATVKAEADFNIERADWGVSYEGKKDDLISAQINFKVSLVAVK